MIFYEGCANPPDLRGAFWSTSPDKTTWTKLSANQFGTPILMQDRYLKVGLCWKQSGSPWPYGCLSRFSVIQWAKPAAA